MRSLQHGRNALQAHAGIDRRLGQRDAITRAALFELHEHEIPDLDKSVAIGVSRARRPAGNFRSVIKEDFRARPARTGVAHGPEIVGRRDANDFTVGKACQLFPDSCGVFVFVVDRDRQALGIDPVFFCDQVPREFNGALFKVVAERKVAKHFKKRVMARRIADVVEVVVLAASAHALLRRGSRRIGTRLLAGEHIFELHHAGVGEHQRRVIARHQRRRRHDLVAIFFEIAEKRRSDFVDAGHKCVRFRKGEKSWRPCSRGPFALST